MGSLTLSKTNRLFWLGRYAERAFVAIEYMQQAYDRSLDDGTFDSKHYCRRLDIPLVYESVEDFFRRYLFDTTNRDSVINSVNFAYDNAIVLRETISSSTLAYMQLVKNVMDKAIASTAPMLDLQNAQDYLMALKGCVDECVPEEESRTTVKIGFTIERIDIYLRLNYKIDEFNKEFARLESRLRRTRIARDGKRLRVLIGLTPCPNPLENKDILLDCVENLFIDV